MKSPNTADAGPGSWPNSWDVVVLGSGPVGLTLANLLGARGIRTLLLERNPATVTEPRAVSIDDESLRTMQAAGIVDAVQSATVAGYGSHYFTAGGRRFAAVEPTGQPYGYPRRNAFRQPVLERQLRDGLARFARRNQRRVIRSFWPTRVHRGTRLPDALPLAARRRSDRAPARTFLNAACAAGSLWGVAAVASAMTDQARAAASPGCSRSSRCQTAPARSRRDQPPATSTPHPPPDQARSARSRARSCWPGKFSFEPTSTMACMNG